MTRYRQRRSFWRPRHLSRLRLLPGSDTLTTVLGQVTKTTSSLDCKVRVPGGRSYCRWSQLGSLFFAGPKPRASHCNVNVMLGWRSARASSALAPAAPRADQLPRGRPARCPRQGWRSTRASSAAQQLWSLQSLSWTCSSRARTSLAFGVVR
jgi:hypothetical protein